MTFSSKFAAAMALTLACSDGARVRHAKGSQPPPPPTSDLSGPNISTVTGQPADEEYERESSLATVGEQALPYVKGIVGTNECPGIPMTAAECRQASADYGSWFVEEIATDWDPEGCFTATIGEFYYNSFSPGKGNPERTPVCWDPSHPCVISPESCESTTLPFESTATSVALAQIVAIALTFAVDLHI